MQRLCKTMQNSILYSVKCANPYMCCNKQICLVIMLLVFLDITEAVDIHDVFTAWLRPPLSSAGKQHNMNSKQVGAELQQSLHNFIEVQSRRRLQSFIGKKPKDLKPALLAGVFSAALKLTSAAKGDIEAILSALDGLLADLPTELDEWPLVRRTVLASLISHQIKHGPFELITQGSKAQRILQQLYDQLKQSARQKGVVEFAHISKSGGTSFCQLAQDNGCHSEDFGWGNCLIKAFNDGPRYFNITQHMQLPADGVQTRCAKGFKGMQLRTREVSCIDRRLRLQELGYSLYANEYTALGGTKDPTLAHPCRNMLTVLEIRHPYERVISHLKHAWFMYGYHCGDDREKVYFADGHNTTHWISLMPAVTNNYLIRSLLGEKVFQLPIGAITRDHLELAKTFLAEQYDVILVLEDKSIFGPTLRYGLGWDKHERHANVRPEGKNSDRCLPADLEALLNLNWLDVQLYSFGTLMARLDAIMYAAAAIAEKERSPRNLAIDTDLPKLTPPLLRRHKDSGIDNHSLLFRNGRDRAVHDDRIGRSQQVEIQRHLLVTGQQSEAITASLRQGEGNRGNSDHAVDKPRKMSNGLPACGWVGSGS
ncbi:hypothetical protein Vafri_2044 [Volvox africanus]|nr:hypothetical protein Vafri_2044 [Volvox africanus]